MPLYECSECHSVDNTALTNFWWNTQQEKKPALCSACDPVIGQWHGKFERITAEEYQRRHPDAKPIEYPCVSPPPEPAKEWRVAWDDGGIDEFLLANKCDVQDIANMLDTGRHRNVRIQSRTAPDREWTNE